MGGPWARLGEFSRSLRLYIHDFRNWIRGGLKPEWGRKPKHFESLEEIAEDYLKSLPNDEARREAVARATNQPVKRPPP